MAERWLRNERLRERLSRKSSDRFCGLEIDRKTNVISLVAFVLSAASVAGQIYFFLQGPVVALQPPEQIVFFGDRAVDGKTYLKLAARMAYVNTGQPGFNDAIKREQADLRIGSRTLTFYWKKYLASDADGTIFRANPKGDALPVAVNAGGVEAHETAFSPLPATAVGKDYGANFIEFSKFQQLALEEKQL
ncbi:MAG TPA: hypothetical protein VD867_13975, partial [Burkholderiales bacterium]|nr:hypothetical protein [Burkholderiales bacterium]